MIIVSSNRKLPNTLYCRGRQQREEVNSVTECTRTRSYELYTSICNISYLKYPCMLDICKWFICLIVLSSYL